MPRNGSGVYSPTAGVPVVSGTTISSTAINNVLDDLGDEITASLPVSGVAPMTGVLRVTLGSASLPGLAFVGDTNTGIYSPGADQLAFATNGAVALTVSATQTTTWAAAATFASTTTFTGVATFSAKSIGKAFDVDAITSVASATTTDIGAAATSEVLITGTTTITGFGTSNAGIRRRGRFEGILTLTHNGTSLILPGAANITTAANDRFEALSLGSGNWIVTDYERAAGSIASVVAGTGISVSTTNGAATVSLSSPLTRATAQATTSGTSIDFTSIPSAAKRIQVVFNQVSTNGSSVPLVQIGDSGGIETSGYDGVSTLSGTGSATVTSSTGFPLYGGATSQLSGVMTIVNVSGNIWIASFVGAAGATVQGTIMSGGSMTLSATLDRVRLTTTNGTDAFDNGSVTVLYE